MQISPRIPRTDAYLSDLACMDIARYSQTLHGTFARINIPSSNIQ